jgi:hypothetical protein
LSPGLWEPLLLPQLHLLHLLPLLHLLLLLMLLLMLLLRPQEAARQGWQCSPLPRPGPLLLPLPG